MSTPRGSRAGMEESTREAREAYMRLALAEARLALDEDEVPVGALVVCGDTVISRAHNRCEQRNDPTAHAELLAMTEASALLGGRLDGCTLYVTLEPCAMCAGAAVNLQLPRLVFGAFDARAGCCSSVFDLLDGSLLFEPEVWSGVFETECAALLTEFFAQKRCNLRRNRVY